MGTKAFWIGILFLPLILLISTWGPTWLEGRTAERRYSVVDHSGWLLEAVEKRALAADLSRVLHDAMLLSKTGPLEPAKLPPILQAAATRLSKVVESSSEPANEAKTVRWLAFSAVGLSDSRDRRPEALPAEAAEELVRSVTDLGQWWRGLSRSEAARISPESSKARFERVPVASDDPRELNRQVEDGSLFAYFVLPRDPLTGAPNGQYICNNVTDRALPDWFRTLAAEEIRTRRLESEGISPTIGEWLEKPVRLDLRRTSGDQDRLINDSDVAGQWLPAVSSLVLWFAIFGVSQMLLTNTIEEKSNRVLEILLSSISPLQIMAGKIVGIAFTGLTVLAAWFASFLAVAYLLAEPMIGPAKTDATPIVGAPLYLTAFLLYFILGYLFYATLLVGIGSICNTLKEAQNMMIPVSLLLFTPLLTLLPVAKDPNGDLAKVLSFIPPFTPFVMMNRAAGPPAVWEYVASSIVLVASIAILFWASSKVFRFGILTSRPPSLRSVLGWLRAPAGRGPVR